MFTKKDGACNCFFCLSGKPHRHAVSFEWDSAGRLQVAESLDPADILVTRVCRLCGHEETDQENKES